MKRRLAVWCCVGYLAAVVLVWLLLRLGGDRWWVATLLLFGPRWLVLVPLPLLAVVALVLRRRLLIPLAAAAVVAVFPVMGFCVPWPSPTANDPGRPRLRVLTCNAGGPNFDAEALGVLVHAELPDVVALQEWTPGLEETVFWAKGWSVHRGVNGLCFASRLPSRPTFTLADDALGGRGAVMIFDVQTAAGPIEVFNVHLATPREGIEAFLDREGGDQLERDIAIRDAESRRAAALVTCPSAVVLGDMNMPCDSALFRRHWGHLNDAFSAAGFGLGHTKRTRWFGVRIDHALVGPAWRVRRCWVGADVGSDHLPVVADLEYQGSPETE